jgi:hypothetical protein
MAASIGQYKILSDICHYINVSFDLATLERGPMRFSTKPALEEQVLLKHEPLDPPTAFEIVFHWSELSKVRTIRHTTSAYVDRHTKQQGLRMAWSKYALRYRQGTYI